MHACLPACMHVRVSLGLQHQGRVNVQHQRRCIEAGSTLRNTQVTAALVHLCDMQQMPS